MIHEYNKAGDLVLFDREMLPMLSLHFWLKGYGKRIALVLFSHMYAIYHGLQLLRLKGRWETSPSRTL